MIPAEPHGNLFALVPETAATAYLRTALDLRDHVPLMIHLKGIASYSSQVVIGLEDELQVLRIGSCRNE